MLNFDSGLSKLVVFVVEVGTLLMFFPIVSLMKPDLKPGLCLPACHWQAKLGEVVYMLGCGVYALQIHHI